MRLLWLFLALAVLFLIPFLVWGDALAFTRVGAVDWLRGYGAWAWMAGMILLMVDLLLPVPGTVAMSALGFIYGPVLGDLISALGSFLAGTLAYSLCRFIGRAAARRILGEKDLARRERLFARVGGWLVVLSRWLPLLPELVACMAGLTRMPAGRFHLALACGTLPVGFTFAAIGHAGSDYPLLTILLSASLPPLLWLLLQPAVRRHTTSV